MDGHLEIECGLDASGRPVLTHQRFCAPFHISKPFEESGALVVNMVNSTPGYFAGDRLQVSAVAKNGAHLVVTAPSASRAHRAKSGKAVLHQRLSVKHGALLEWIPEIFIPHAGACFAQHTKVDVEAGGTLLFCEMMAPGRVAMGEQFVFEELDWSLEVVSANRALLKERFRLRSTDHSVAGLKTDSGAYHGSWYAVGAAFEGTGVIDQSDLYSMPDISGARVGFSRLIAGGWIVRFLAKDSVALRKAAGSIRNLLYHTASRSAPSLRRGAAF